MLKHLPQKLPLTKIKMDLEDNDYNYLNEEDIAPGNIGDIGSFTKYLSKNSHLFIQNLKITFTL